MSQASDNFERQIERIHSLVESEDAVVTWDDHLPDPDNPTRARQIDVSIRRNGALTLVECRLHAEPQDVQWIEELIGRRISLKADMIIAVSASGFTRGAILKARAHGIVLRDMKSLTEEEIRSWGRRTRVSVEFYRFENVTMVFVFAAEHAGQVSVDDVGAALANREIVLLPLFDKLVELLREKDSKFPPMVIETSATHADMRVGDKRVLGIRLRAECHREEKELAIPNVVAYDAPDIDALERNAYVEIVEQGRFEITRSSDTVSVAMDVASLGLPRGRKLGPINFAFDRPVEMREIIFLGEVEPGFWLGPLDVGVDFQ
jgi:hypothetical protein